MTDLDLDYCLGRPWRLEEGRGGPECLVPPLHVWVTGRLGSGIRKGCCKRISGAGRRCERRQIGSCHFAVWAWTVL